MDIKKLYFAQIKNSLESPHYARNVMFNDVELNNQSTFDFRVDSDNNIVYLVDENQEIVLPDSDITFEETASRL